MCCLLFGTVPREKPPYVGKQSSREELGAPTLGFTQIYHKPPLVRSPSKPDDCGRDSWFLYSEYFRTAARAHTFCCWPAILEHNPLRVSYLYLSPTLHAICCRHLSLLLFLLLLYCYYRSKALSTPLGLLKLRSQDSGERGRSRDALCFPLTSLIKHSS